MLDRLGPKKRCKSWFRVEKTQIKIEIEEQATTWALCLPSGTSDIGDKANMLPAWSKVCPGESRILLTKSSWHGSVNLDGVKPICLFTYILLYTPLESTPSWSPCSSVFIDKLSTVFAISRQPRHGTRRPTVRWARIFPYFTGNKHPVENCCIFGTGDLRLG